MSDLSQESPLWREWAESRHSVQQMREELDSLRAELEIARKDAGRYRWLRNESWSLTHCGRKYPRVAQTVVITDPYMRVTLLAEEALDAAVDAAMGGGNG